MTTAKSLLYPNGVDATTGDYLLPPTPVDEFARVATTSTFDRASDAELAARYRRVTEPVYAPKHGVDPADLARTGWGVVFADGVDPRVVTALTPLLERRHAQAGAESEHRYREFIGADGYRGGESKQDFLRRHGSGPGPVDPDVIPYYLLLVGGPDEIPFEVQYQLDVQHAVGRIHFDDAAGYAHYAANVVAAETRQAQQERARLAFFATCNENDPATALSAEYLVTPLAASLGQAELPVRSIIGADASRDSLCALLTGAERPDLLFTATHGVGFPAGHPDQRVAQGALVCQDWPGPGRGAIAAHHWFGAGDVPRDDLTGLIAVLFACYGAGTPRHDDFDRGPDSRSLAPDPFVAALPQALLGREGGALAVVGHVDRALGYSFLWPGAGQQTEVYRSTLAELVAGQPIGSALEYVGDRYAEITTDLRAAVEDARQGWRTDDAMLAGLWSAFIDARGFVLLGDPAARLAPATPHPIGATTRTAPVTVSATQGKQQGDAGPAPETLVPERADPVEVATYVTADPGGVDYDPATGRISGARLCLFSSVDLDGTAAHVATTQASDPPADPAVAELHARLVEISIAARRANQESLPEPEGAP